MNVNAKAFVPNFTAKPFVPSFSGGSSNEATPAAAPAPASTSSTSAPTSTATRNTFFRYTIHAPATTGAHKDVNAEGEKISLISQLQAKGVLRANPTGGPTADALNEFSMAYFHSLERPPDSTRLGFLVSTEMLPSGPGVGAAGSTATVSPLDGTSGYLLPLIVPSNPQQEHHRNMFAVWNQMFYALQNSTFLSDVKAFGHITRVWKQDADTTPVILHYIFVAVTQESDRMSTLLFENVALARQCIRVPSLLLTVLDSTRRVASLHLTEKSSDPLPTAFAEAKPTPLRLAAPSDVDSLSELITELEKLVAGELDAEDVDTRLVVLSVGTKGKPSVDFLRLVLRCCWDFMVVPINICLTEANMTKYLAENSVSILWHQAPDLVATANCFSNRAIKNPEDCLQQLKQTSLSITDLTKTGSITGYIKNTEITATLPLNMKSGCPFQAACFSPVEDLTQYLAVRDLINLVGSDVERKVNDQGDSHKTKRLRNSNFNDATKHIAAEAYRLRRTAVGQRVLVIVDSQQTIFLVDAETQRWITTLPTFRGVSGMPSVWSGTLNASSCVMEGTLVASFRGEAQYKVLVHDVLLWNNVKVTENTLPQRMHHVEGTTLECDTNWAASSPFNIVVLRVNYIPVDKGPQLLNQTFSEHPSCGFTMMPCAAPAKDVSARLPAYSWCPPESTTVNFVASSVEEITSTGRPAYRVNRVPLMSRKDVVETTEEDLETCSSAGSSADQPAQRTKTLQPYGEEYVDYLLSTAPNLNPLCTIQCLIQREPDGAHWWEIVKGYTNNERAIADTTATINSVVHDPNVTTERAIWICGAGAFLCQECSNVDELGADDTSVGKFYCRSCWETYGYGNCKQCGAVFTQGSLDSATNAFYCKNCWAQFIAAPSTAVDQKSVREVPASPTGQGDDKNIPARPDTTAAGEEDNAATAAGKLLSILKTRLVSVAGRCTTTTDVLALCCGPAADIRKWVEIGCTSYLGVDLSSSVLTIARERAEVLTTQLDQQDNGEAIPHFDFICADCHHRDFWGEHLAKARSSQCNIITFAKGLTGTHLGENNAGDSTSSASSSSSQGVTPLGGIGKALVPNGVALGLVLDAQQVANYAGTSSSVSNDFCSIQNVSPNVFNVTLHGDSFVWGSMDMPSLVADAKAADLSLVTLGEASATKASTDLPPTVQQFIRAHCDGEEVKLLDSLNEEENRVLSFFRLVLLRKGATSAPLTEPSKGPGSAPNTPPVASAPSPALPIPL